MRIDDPDAIEAFIDGKARHLATEALRQAHHAQYDALIAEFRKIVEYEFEPKNRVCGRPLSSCTDADDKHRHHVDGRVMRDTPDVGSVGSADIAEALIRSATTPIPPHGPHDGRLDMAADVAAAGPDRTVRAEPTGPARPPADTRPPPPKSPRPSSSPGTKARTRTTPTPSKPRPTVGPRDSAIVIDKSDGPVRGKGYAILKPGPEVTPPAARDDDGRVVCSGCDRPIDAMWCECRIGEVAMDGTPKASAYATEFGAITDDEMDMDTPADIRHARATATS